MCTSTLAFLSGYYSRDVGTSKSTNSSLVCLFLHFFIADADLLHLSYVLQSRVISHITQVARDQYSTFAELCEGLDSANDIDGSEVSSDDEEPDTVEDKEEEKDVETPKAVRQEAVGPFSNIPRIPRLKHYSPMLLQTDYFAPTMSSRRQSNASSITLSYPPPPQSTPAPVSSYFPTYSPASPSFRLSSPTRSKLSSSRVQSPLVSLDEMVFKWADSIVSAMTPALDRHSSGFSESKIEEVNEDEWVLRSPKVLREMYEVFKGEVAHIMNS